MTFDIIGKHIYEFKRSSDDEVPEIFILIVSFFEINNNLLETEGIFRITSSIDKIDELQLNMIMGNYYYLTEMIGEPHAVACFFKKVLRCMGEPLCTFKLYSRFRDLAGIIMLSYAFVIDYKGDERI